MDWRRIIRHLATPEWASRRAFRPADLAAIEAAVAASEQQHRGELRFVAEGPLPAAALLRDQSARQRAVDLFARLRVWDTADNSGVLIYVQLADRRVEILADRGIAARVDQSEWDVIYRGMEAAFRVGAYRRGALDAIEAATRLLAIHFPAAGNNPNELPNRPEVL